jgi:hypothetical protein
VLAAQEPPKAAGKLTIVGRPTITIKPLCNPDGKGETNITVRNAGPETTMPALMPGDVISRTPAKTLANAKVELAKPGQLAANQTADVAVTVRNVFEQGDFEATLQNAGTDVGTLHIVRSNPPFSIAVDTANPADPELSFTRGQLAHFRLKNADPRGYSINWIYSVDGKTVQSDHAIDILADGEKEITFSPPKEWFWGRFTSLFKDKTSDGYLTVLRSENDPGCGGQAAASKDIKTKTHLAGWKAGIAKELLADSTVFVLLALGGFLSLMLNSALPNQMRRVKLKESLNTMGAQIRGLSYGALASRLRVMVGVELRLLRDKLRNLSWTNPDFSTDIDGIEADVRRLGNRLQVLGALGATRVNFQKARAQGLPPSLMVAMEQTFEKIVEIGKKSDPTDADVQSAQALIKGIQDQLDAGVQVTAPAVAAVAQRIRNFKQVFGQQGQLGATATCQRVKSKLPGPFTDLLAIDETKLTADVVLPDDFVSYDRLLFKLDKLQRYIHLVEGLPNTAAGFRSQIVGQEDPLLDFLGRESWDAMFDSQLLLREMEGGVFPEDLEGEITAGRIRVDFDPQTVRPYQPVQFSLLFVKIALNDAPAREAWTCCWTFSRDQEGGLAENGWVVTHYFQKAGAYQIKIDLIHTRSGKALPVPNVERLQNGQLSVSPIPKRSWSRVLQLIFQLKFAEARSEWRKSQTGAGRRLEWLRLLLALFVALIGLLAGAKEQLLKLDVLPALLAVFLIGFGADQVKNLLTRKPSETGTTTAH